MNLLPGVYQATKKDGSIYYRSSITHNNKHISLGSYPSQLSAHLAYETANDILRHEKYILEDYTIGHILTFDKWVSLMNLRDNNYYIKTPIYMKDNYFLYYLSFKEVYKFDTDDLFYYASHKIMKRGGYLFVSDFGMQVNILSRYGIKNFSVKDKDYYFINGDVYDYRYSNIGVVNPYNGVSKVTKNLKTLYTTKILVNGSYIVGHYETEVEAAIAYNKAINILKAKGSTVNYTENYIPSLNHIDYATLYHKIKISKRLRNLNL